VPFEKAFAPFKSPKALGSLFFSHINDAGFWLVKEYFGMTVGQTIKTWSVMETLLSVVGLVFIPLCGLVF
jgi:GntP family gluconate:H+ symporter